MEWTHAAYGAPLAADVPGRRGDGAGWRPDPGATAESRYRLPGGLGDGPGDGTARPGAAVRQLDLGTAQRLPGAHHRRASRAGLAAGAAAPPTLCVWPSQTH